MEPKPGHLSDAYAMQFSDRSVVAAYRHRPAYPPATFTLLTGLMTTTAGAVLDAGCGTGDIARGLAPLVGRVDAVDMSAPMIATGQTLAGGDHPNLRWIAGRLEEVTLTAPYALVTAGESLHWMDWQVVLPRFREVLVPGGVLAIIGREAAPAPWDDRLLLLIQRFSTNREYQPYDLVHELERRGLFSGQGGAGTPAMEVCQLVPDYVESIHSRNGFSRERMGPADAAAFDREVTALVTPFAAAGLLCHHITARITWGMPCG